MHGIQLTGGMPLPGMTGGPAGDSIGMARLTNAAHEFEGQMMKELLKPMTSSDPLTGEEDSEGSAGALGEFAAEALGKALSEQGGLGIAKKIVADLTHFGNKRAGYPSAGVSHGNTE